MSKVYVIATAYNEERMIDAFVDHYLRQGCHILVGDDGSDDSTLPKLRAWEVMSYGKLKCTRMQDSALRDGFSIRRNLDWRMEQAQVLADLEGDEPWFLMVDIDEHFVPPEDYSIAGLVSELQDGGYNQASCTQAVFVPWLESPDHDHPWFTETMRYYYPMKMHGEGNILFRFQRQWGFSDAGKTITLPGGGNVFRSCILKHYFFLSMEHARRKWNRPISEHDPDGWHRWDDFAPEHRPDMLEVLSKNVLRLWEGPNSDMTDSYARHIVRTPRPRQLFSSLRADPEGSV